MPLMPWMIREPYTQFFTVTTPFTSGTVKGDRLEPITISHRYSEESVEKAINQLTRQDIPIGKISVNRHSASGKLEKSIQANRNWRKFFKNKTTLKPARK